MESYSQPPANEYPCRNSGVMGLELDGLMCNKDRDRQEEFCKAAFFRTLRCNRNDQKHLTAAFSVSLLER